MGESGEYDSELFDWVEKDRLTQIEDLLLEQWTKDAKRDFDVESIDEQLHDIRALALSAYMHAWGNSVQRTPELAWEKRDIYVSGLKRMHVSDGIVDRIEVAMGKICINIDEKIKGS